MRKFYKILFLLPLWDRKFQWGKFRRGAGNNNFNYGLASIAAVLKNAGYDVYAFDPNLHSFNEEELKKYLQRGGFHLIGIPCYTPTVIEVYGTAKICKSALPYCKIIVGGVHPSLYPRQTLEDCEFIDFVCVGEGEYVMFDIAELIFLGKINEKTFEYIKGLAYRDNGKVFINERRELIKDISELPLPAYNVFELEKYEMQPTGYKRLPAFTMVASRGCPYSCSFCQVQTVLGRKARFRSVNKVIEEIEFLINNYGAKGIMFHDGTFTVNRKWVDDFCRTLIKEKIEISWMCLTRVDTIDEDLLRLMKKSGCYGMSFGIESFNQKSLDLMKKNVTVQQNIDALNIALKLNFYVTATYIICFPGESKKDTLHTIETAKKIGAHIAHFFYPLPYPETDLWHVCKETGGLREDLEWQHYSMTYNEEPVYVNPLIGIKTQKELHAYALKSYYLQPKVIWRNLKTINSFTDIKKYFKAALALSWLWV